MSGDEQDQPIAEESPAADTLGPQTPATENSATEGPATETAAVDSEAADTTPVSVPSPLETTPASSRWRRPLALSREWSHAWSARLTQQHKLVLVALLLAVVLAAGSGALALAGARPWALWAGGGAALAVPSPTPSPTATLEPTFTATPTAIPTATPIGSWPTGGIDLGCGSASLHPPSYVVRSGVTSPPAVALTFDDGPSPDWTATMLDTLEQTHTPATFFVVGASVRAYPDLIRREAADGFAIAIHTWDHPFMTQLSPDARAWELAHTAQAIHNVLGPSYCLPYWRPPFGDFNDDVLAQTRQMGLTTVTWGVVPLDFQSPGVQVIVDRVLARVHPGAIVLLHDGYFHRGETAHALPQIIQGLHDRGLQPVTVPQLLTGRIPTPPPSPDATTPLPSPTPIVTATSTPTPTPKP
jgi:peptidoglycan-N-acetylglucosamine deacetylase